MNDINKPHFYSKINKKINKPHSIIFVVIIHYLPL